MKEMKNIRMYGVMSHALDQVWHEVKPLLQLAINKTADGKYESSDVYEAIKAKDMQLWIAFDDEGLCAILVTQIICFPRKKVLRLVFTAGERFEDWLHLFDEIKNFAKHHGCESVEGYGRPGWEKKSKPLGFQKIHTIFTLPL